MDFLILFALYFIGGALCWIGYTLSYINLSLYRIVKRLDSEAFKQYLELDEKYHD
jgi:hypothetical protein